MLRPSTWCSVMEVR